MEENNNVLETSNEETLSEINDKSNESGITLKDYKIMIDMIRETDEQIKTMESVLNSKNQSLNLKDTVLVDALSFDSIDEDNVEKFKDFLNSHAIDKSVDFDSKSNDEILDIMKTVKDEAIVLAKTQKEADDIKNSANDIMKDYFNYMTSDKVKKAKEEKLKDLKKSIEFIDDPLQKKKTLELIDIMESSLSFDFLKDRFESYGSQEIYNIQKGFFDSFKGSYIIDRYKKKITKYGYDENIYKYFFNIEENFLSEKYHPFNNLFLYIYMRMIAYSDPYSKKDSMLIKSLTGAMANLIYHKFDKSESEVEFIQVISNIDNYFIDYIEVFKNCNTTYENHPARKQLEEQYETKRKEELITKINDILHNDIEKFEHFNINDENIKNMNSDQLQTLYNSIKDELVNNSIKTDDENKEITEDVENKEIIEGADAIIDTSDEVLNTSETPEISE